MSQPSSSRDDLREFSSTFSRPDSSGERDHGRDLGPEQRPSNFPYDLPVDYGNPRNYDIGSQQDRSFNTIVPKDTSHTTFDDDVTEAQGTPISTSRGAASQSTAGPLGTNGAWASGMGSWDANEVDDDELQRCAEGISVPIGKRRDILILLGVDPELASRKDGDSEISRVLSALGLVQKESPWQVLWSKISDTSV